MISWFLTLRLGFSTVLDLASDFFYAAGPYNQHVSTKCPEHKTCFFFLPFTLGGPASHWLMGNQSTADDADEIPLLFYPC